MRLIPLLIAAAAAAPSHAQEPPSEGTVVVEIVVSPEGTVTEAHVVSSNMPAEFSDVAIAKAREGRFRPKELNGKPVETRGTFSMRFRLAPDAGDPPAQPGAALDGPAAARPGRE